jgi:ATP-dependent Clp protease ATP-binding subunit ClpB
MYNFSRKISGSFDIAQTKAISEKNTELKPIHLLYGLAKNPSSKFYKNLTNKLDEIETQISKLPSFASDFDPESIKPSSKLIAWLSSANSIATQEGKDEITEDHLISTAPKEFAPFISHISFDGSSGSSTEEKPDYLIDLNELAREGKLDPVIGRTTEIRSALEILGRRSKNNPILVGEAGVGKTAVIEGLAGLIEGGDIPDTLNGQTIYSLNLGSLMAGTKYRGEFEERIETLLKFMKEQSGKAILFIDEIHMLIGAGKTDGAMDAANLLKPALARGEIKCIGATTQDEYQKYILSDSALDRRFRPITISEPSSEDSIEILLGLKEKFEAHHGVTISNDAIYNAVFWSKQYIQHRNLPDKAIDLIDEATSAKKFSIEAMPAELVSMEADLRAKQTLALTHENNPELENEIEELKTSLENQKSEWKKEVSTLKQVASLKKTLDTLQFDQIKAEKEGDFEKASQIKYSQIPAVKEQITQSNVVFDLTKEDVAEVLSRQSGIPKEKILSSEQEKILLLEDYLNENVFGQNSSTHEISETLIASHAGLSDPTRPLASFMLAGPSGVGKTETAKALSRFFFNSDEQVIRIDLSEFSEKHSISKLIGAPAGYVGYDEGGVLTEAVRKQPYAIILFDEVEKAHEDFADILLQVLDDGRLTDNKGRTVSFRNTMIFLTTNSKNIREQFKPEVIGRLDGVLTFNSLDKSIMTQLVDKEVKMLSQRIKPKGISLELSHDVKDLLSRGGFDSAYGARPLRSYFQKTIVRPLSKVLLQGSIQRDPDEKLKTLKAEIKKGTKDIVEFR